MILFQFFKPFVNDASNPEQLFNEITQLNFVGEGSEFLDAVSKVIYSF